ncbi:MAG TPA: ATP-grasp domain-containing protein, partial [Gammaproteobacteria bacterium]|nr:ATP-grasp domain-containing protein [Gammaproteobacteria bacterium]
MNLHEYQAKRLFAAYDIPVPNGRPATTPDAAAAAARDLGGSVWVVKAQVHAGGRGKAGGVKLCYSHDEVRAAAAALLGRRLTTHQTGPAGLPINTVLVESGSDIERELYLSVLVDRAREQVVFMASAAGGMEIEEVAARTPEKIFRVWVHPAAGVQPHQVRDLAFGLGLEPKEQQAVFGKIVHGLYQLFMQKDASLVEINPLIVTTAGRVLALDAKVNLDDNALYRQPELAAMRDASQE